MPDERPELIPTPAEVPCWVDDMGFLWAGPFPAGYDPSGRGLCWMRFEGIRDVKNYGVTAVWRLRSRRKPPGATPYPVHRANRLVERYLVEFLFEFEQRRKE